MPNDNIDFGSIDFGSIDTDTPIDRTAQMSDILKQFKSGAKLEKQIFTENTDSEYWFCVCFQTRAQKEEFLKKIGWSEFGDKYLDGIDVAAHQKIALDSPTPPIRKRSINKRWLKHV